LRRQERLERVSQLLTASPASPLLPAILAKHQRLYSSGLASKLFTASLVNLTTSSVPFALLSFGALRNSSDKEKALQLQAKVEELVKRVAADSSTGQKSSVLYTLLNYLNYLNVDINRDYGNGHFTILL